MRKDPKQSQRRQTNSIIEPTEKLWAGKLCERLRGFGSLQSYSVYRLGCTVKNITQMHGGLSKEAFFFLYPNLITITNEVLYQESRVNGI